MVLDKMVRKALSGEVMLKLVLRSGKEHSAALGEVVPGMLESPPLELLQ